MIKEQYREAIRILAGELSKLDEQKTSPGVDLLALMGSFGDTLEDDEWFELLKQYAESGKVIQETIEEVTP